MEWTPHWYGSVPATQGSSHMRFRAEPPEDHGCQERAIVEGSGDEPDARSLSASSRLCSPSSARSLSWDTRSAQEHQQQHIHLPPFTYTCQRPANGSDKCASPDLSATPSLTDGASYETSRSSTPLSTGPGPELEAASTSDEILLEGIHMDPLVLLSGTIGAPPSICEGAPQPDQDLANTPADERWQVDYNAQHNDAIQAFLADIERKAAANTVPFLEDSQGRRIWHPLLAPFVGGNSMAGEEHQKNTHHHHHRTTSMEPFWKWSILLQRWIHEEPENGIFLLLPTQLMGSSSWS